MGATPLRGASRRRRTDGLRGRPRGRSGGRPLMTHRSGRDVRGPLVFLTCLMSFSPSGRGEREMRVVLLVLDGVFDTGLATVRDAFATANELAELTGVASPRFTVDV